MNSKFGDVGVDFGPGFRVGRVDRGDGDGFWMVKGVKCRWINRVIEEQMDRLDGRGADEAAGWSPFLLVCG
jgi:hypothetical protein